ncbi:LOW QUALITY PROTEIN: tumor necrosis factor receptor superfamily member 21 [Osmerus eperlanus]|uniref:LOW QUALITY PROTEIN: tumor necrosis factor receptor superfamily member 21 n=1 Tax=Osmerus eperlanus TaxID=29151 RepID=UPI002E150177
MSVVYISVALLCMLVGAPAPPLPSPGPPGPLSTRHYYHPHPPTGARLLCDKCPAGTYVSRHCTPASVRECSRCPSDTFTPGETGAQQCHPCRSACPPGLLQKQPCSPVQDRLCVCPPESFPLGGVCQPLSLCPPGEGVRRRGGEREDVRCRPCARGTFSDEASSVLRCRPHTDCLEHGLVLLQQGTKDSDNICGPAPSLSPLGSALTGFVQDGSTWSRLPADRGLRAGVQDLDLSSGLLVFAPSGTLETLTLASTPTPPPASSPTHTPAPHTPPFHLPPTASTAPPVGTPPPSGGLEDGSGGRVGHGGGGYKPPRRGSPRPSAHSHFDINEHLPWMTVLLLLVGLLLVVGCSVKRSSRTLEKGPRQDPSSIVERASHKRTTHTQAREKWLYYPNGQGVDILKLVSSQMGGQWVDMYQSLANASEREVAAFSSSYGSDQERAYAALQHWTVRDHDASLAKLISALHRHRRTDVVEKMRCVIEDNPQFDVAQLMVCVNVPAGPSPPWPADGPGVVEGSPVDRSKGFFPDESEPLLRCDSTSSKDSALSRTGSFITKEKKDTVLRQVRLDPCNLQPIFDDMLHILNPEELRVVEEIPAAEDKLDRLFEIAGVKSHEASQTLLDSVYSHLPELL